MQAEQITQAASLLWSAWQQGKKIEGLPEHCRPQTRADGHAIQAKLQELSGQNRFGWKIGATSAAGQKHVGTDGPFQGRLLSQRVGKPGAAISLANNLMRVAEIEFAFAMARDLPARGRDYGVDEVVQAVASMHPAIEIPDSRYNDFAKVGGAQLIADNGCACWFVLGEPVQADWRNADLAQHKVSGLSNGTLVKEGSGANALGDPRIALTWLANELTKYADGLKAGEVITTGTVVVPFDIKPGDRLRGEFGAFGSVECTIAP
jgi:2-keto-4-pentenoate hydratase